jgi:hypothetical protein
MLPRPRPKSRTCGFRLTAEKHDLLVKVALRERRKLADLVHLMVVDALAHYARNAAIGMPTSATGDNRSQNTDA